MPKPNMLAGMVRPPVGALSRSTLGAPLAAQLPPAGRYDAQRHHEHSQTDDGVRSENPAGDEVEYLAGLFLVRAHDGTAFLPSRPEVLLGLPTEQREGVWYVVRADFPNDAFAHVRHCIAAFKSQTTVDAICSCAVEEIALGTWLDAGQVVRKLLPGAQPTV